MTDLEKTIEQTTDNTENVNSAINPNNDLGNDLWVSVEQNSPDFSNIFSENVSGNNASVENIPEEDNFSQNYEPEQELEMQTDNAHVQENVSTSATIEAPEWYDNLQEKLNSTPVQEVVNNEVILWKFDNAIVNTIEDSNNPSNLDNSLLDHAVILEKSPITEANEEEERQKNRLLQKEKLTQLIKTHESKSQKIWFAKWILSGVLLTIWVIAISFVFAKDQILDLLNISWESSLTASVVDLTENSDESYSDDTLDDEFFEDNNDTISNTEEFDDFELEEDFNGNIDNEYPEVISSEESDNFESDENLDEETNNEYIEDTLQEYTEEFEVSESDENLDEETKELYNISHVDSEAEANWVLPSHCSDLTCYGEDKEFTPCTTFRLSENLDENANRIGNNWVCRYKDSSELVFVEFN